MFDLPSSNLELKCARQLNLIEIDGVHWLESNSNLLSVRLIVRELLADPKLKIDSFFSALSAATVNSKKAGTSADISEDQLVESGVKVIGFYPVSKRLHVEIPEFSTYETILIESSRTGDITINLRCADV